MEKGGLCVWSIVIISRATKRARRTSAVAPPIRSDPPSPHVRPTASLQAPFPGVGGTKGVNHRAGMHGERRSSHSSVT
jgi:hypothetical protein